MAFCKSWWHTVKYPMSGAMQNSCHEFQWGFGNLSSPAETKVLNRVGHLTVALFSICITNQILNSQFKMHQVLIKNNPLHSVTSVTKCERCCILVWPGSFARESHMFCIKELSMPFQHIICRNSCPVHHISDIKRSLDQIDSVTTHSRNPFCCTCSEPRNLLWNMANVADVAWVRLRFDLVPGKGIETHKTNDGPELGHAILQWPWLYNKTRHKAKKS